MSKFKDVFKSLTNFINKTDIQVSMQKNETHITVDGETKSVSLIYKDKTEKKETPINDNKISV